ncbi:MAG: hypothetical protein GY789_10310 [Hyphomicrobiales bacterium]|nr:hypothetical protein [Hyphomicrobiales bacterium]MCP5001818.1 hypothetical protein [Hyphomicrobiales bacterium]
MLNKTLVSVFTLVFLSNASQAIAGTTGWFNYSDPKIRAEKINKAERSLAAGSSYTRVRC